MTAEIIEGLGGWASVIKTKTHPIVRGGIKGRSDHRLLRVDMYDVQPPEPLDEWVSPPWAAEIKGDRIIARGASNNKGPLRAYFNALQAILEVEGELPCSIEFLIEGEEEIGSYALQSYVMDHKDELAACAALDGFFPYQPSPTAPPPIELGW
ncbi:MAG: M20/M25/M40 family metallo-hydrolase [Methanobacteriota archaeon]